MIEKEEIAKDQERLRGKVIAVTFAQLGDGSSEGYRGVDFSPKGPLFVLVSSNPLDDHDLSGNDELIDTYWDADALPGQLLSPDYVSWIYGPTYLDNGTQTWDTRVIHPLADFLSALPSRDLNEFFVILEEDPVIAPDWIEDHDGNRKWVDLLGEKVNPIKRD